MKTSTEAHPLTRRDFLQRLSVAMGGAASAFALSSSTVSAALAFQTGNAADANKGIFSAPQSLTLRAVVDTIMPKTKTPSASELNCHSVMNHLLAACYDKDTQAGAKDCIDTIDKLSIDRHNAPFVVLSQEQQTQLLRDVDSGNNVAEHTNAQFRQLKYLLVFSYFTSQVGATQVLRYQAVPGGFKGSVKVTEETRTWSSKDFY